jgi:hypothetical protein
VGPDLQPTTAVPTRADLPQCPHCRGAVRADAPWCTQCWADLRPAPAPDPAPQPVPDPVPAPDPLTAAEAAPSARAAAGWPCGTCGAVNGLDLDACADCGAGFLTALRASEPPLLALPGIGDVTQLGRGQRLGLAAGVALALVLLVALLALLTG